MMVAKQPRELNEINQWHKDFEQVRQQWLAWLNINFGHYQSSQEAWSAFKAQQQAYISIPNIKTLH